MLEPIYIDHLEHNLWFSQLPYEFQTFIVNHAIQKPLIKGKLSSIQAKRLMVYMLFYRVLST